jgi:DNA-binding transcriptional ArsR family regulator
VAALVNAVRRYIHEVLGIVVPEARPWAHEKDLPYFLKDAFQFSEIELLGHPIILAMGRPEAKRTLSDVRTWLNRVRELAGGTAIYVTEALASYERRRLIELKVPFIREYFRQRATAVEALSPSAQAMLITALLRHVWEEEWRPAKTAAELGYTPMTLSRVIKELTGAGLASLHAEGRARWLCMAGPPQAIWERAKPALRTPIRGTFWVADDTTLVNYPRRLAGMSALARHSMLAEPRWPVYAISTADWKAATEAGVRVLPEPVAGAQEWQVWSYKPALVPGEATVDPLSLTLSLQDNGDDRVQIALDELQGRIPW